MLLKTRSDISFVVVIFNLFTVNFYEKSEFFLNQINILDVDIIYYMIKSSIFTNFTDTSFAYFIVKKNQHFISKYIFLMINKISQNLLKNIFFLILTFLNKIFALKVFIKTFIYIYNLLKYLLMLISFLILQISVHCHYVIHQN